MVKSIGEKIEMRIDEDKRRLYARIHSAGHLLDMAVGRLGYKW
jgi:Ser-tRNA(Ala) deacylase AlaX